MSAVLKSDVERIAAEKIEKCGREVSMRKRFFAAAVLKLVRNQVQTYSVETMCTDGNTLWYNPEWIAPQPELYIETILAHEGMHVMMRHSLRRNGRDARLYNIACDYAINDHLVRDGFEMPEHGLHDAQYRGLASEDIYDLLLEKEEQDAEGEEEDENKEEDEQNPDEGEGDGSGEGEGDESAPPQDSQDPGQMGGVIDATDEDGNELTPEKRDELDARQRTENNKSEQLAKAMGQHSPGLSEALSLEEPDPTMPWEQLLRQYMTAIAKDDFTYRRPNKRHMSRGLIAPSLHSNGMGKLGVFIDCSGSIDQRELAMFLSELNSIIETIQPEEVVVIQADTHVVGDVESFDASTYPIEIEARLGGGTSFEPPFEHCEAEGIELQCAIYFTDMCSSYFPQDPGYPVIWAATPNEYAEYYGKPPFGEVIELSFD